MIRVLAEAERNIKNAAEQMPQSKFDNKAARRGIPSETRSLRSDGFLRERFSGPPGTTNPRRHLADFLYPNVTESLGCT
jgi:hypothetical protein